MTLVGKIVEAKIPAKKPVTHKVIGERMEPFPRVQMACGVAMRSSDVQVVLASSPTCGNCQRRGKRVWREPRSYV